MPITKPREFLDTATARALSAAAGIDPRTLDRTLMKVLRGEPVRSPAGSRALAILTEAGLLPAPGAQQ